MRAAATTRGGVRRHTSMIGTVVLLLVLTACAGPAGTAGDVDAAELDGAWELASGVGPEGEIELIDDHPITLEIEGDDWRGTAACNSYSGTVGLEGDQLAMDGFAVTEMACMPEEVMDSEAAYLAGLRTVETWSLRDERLVLEGPGTELVFQR